MAAGSHRWKVWLADLTDREAWRVDPLNRPTLIDKEGGELGNKRGRSDEESGISD